MDVSREEPLGERRDQAGQDEGADAAPAPPGGQSNAGEDVFAQIHTGMLVFDREGQQLGTVDGVFHGRPEDETAAVAPGRVRAADDGTTEGVPPGRAEEEQTAAGRSETLNNYQTPPGTPPPVETSDQDLQAALHEPQMRRGYIHLGGTDLPERARYVPFEQIERRDDLRILLKASRAELEDLTP
jgi:hypothetical protein